MLACKVIVAVVLFVIVFGGAILTSDTGLPLLAVYGSVLAASLVEISSLSGSKIDVKKYSPILLVLFWVNMFVFDLSTSFLIEKRRLFDGWLLLYPLGIAFQVFLSFLYLTAISFVTRNKV